MQLQPMFLNIVVSCNLCIEIMVVRLLLTSHGGVMVDSHQPVGIQGPVNAHRAPLHVGVLCSHV